MATDEIIVLANSRKLGGRCVAGISRRSGSWVRPVSTYPHGELDVTQTRVEGRQVRELDVVEIDLGEAVGEPYQPENVRVGQAPWGLVEVVAPDAAVEVLGPFMQRTGAAVPEEDAELGVEASLTLVEPSDEVIFRLPPPTETQGQLKPKACFKLGPKEYELNVTDFIVAPQILGLGLGEYSSEELGFGHVRPRLTISLAEPHNGWCTKLVAGVVFLPL